MDVPKKLCECKDAQAEPHAVKKVHYLLQEYDDCGCERGIYQLVEL